MKEFLFLDGELFDKKIPFRSLFYAEGVFETFRWKGSPPVYFKTHLDRMKRGAEFLFIPFPDGDSIENSVDEAVEQSNVRDAYVKICLLSSGGMKFYERADKGHVLVAVRNYEPPKEQMRTHVVSFKRNSSSQLLRIKSLNYLENVLARREASCSGYDECIFLNERDEVAEGSATNIFWVKEGTLYTPAVDCGLLPGITREALISLAPKLDLEVEEGKFNLDELLSSSGAFLTNSLVGIAPITEVDKTKMALDKELSTKLRDALFQKLKWI